MTVTSACSCALGENAFGSHGWHWRINPRWPGAEQMAIAYERCGHYMAVVAEAERREPTAARRARR